MGFFSFVQEIAMDLGTANTIIISDDKIVVDEPSVVALDRHTDKMIAVGSRAKMMYEKTHDNIRTVRPLRDGVIADFSAWRWSCVPYATVPSMPMAVMYI